MIFQTISFYVCFICKVIWLYFINLTHIVHYVKFFLKAIVSSYKKVYTF